MDSKRKSSRLRKAERSVFRASGDLTVALGDIHSDGDPELYELVRRQRDAINRILADIRDRREQQPA